MVPQSQIPFIKERGLTHVQVFELTLSFPIELIVGSHVTHLLTGFPTQTIDVISLHPHIPESYQVRAGLVQVHLLPPITGVAVFAAAFLH